MDADARGTGSARPRMREDIAGRLVEWIDTGVWRPGSRVPTETKLAESLGVSRPTLREALRTLEEDGYLHRIRGSGTFVIHRPHVKNNIELNFGVSELIQSMGMRPGTERLKVFESKPAEEEIQLLELSPDTPVVVIERVRTADGVPVVFSRDVLPRFLLEGCGEVAEQLAQGSIYHLLADLQVTVTQGIATIIPARADSLLATALRVRRGTMLVYLRQVDYMADGRPVMLSHEHHLASAFEITVRRKGPGLVTTGGAG